MHTSGCLHLQLHPPLCPIEHPPPCCLQIRKTLFDSADVATPYGPTVADVANAISALRGKLTIAVNSATAPDGDDQGITTSSGVSFISWGP